MSSSMASSMTNSTSYQHHLSNSSLISGYAPFSMNESMMSSGSGAGNNTNNMVPPSSSSPVIIH